MRHAVRERRADRPAGSSAPAVIAAVVGTLVIVAVLVGLALAWDARTAYAELRSTADGVRVLEEQALSGDIDGTTANVEAIQESARRARAALAGPHWDLAGMLPVVGDDVRAVQAVSIVADDLATGAVGELGEALQILDPANLGPEGGKIDLVAFQAAAPRVDAAHRSVEGALGTLSAIETDGLLPQVRGPVLQVRDRVGDLAGLTATAARAAALIPPMMGAEGPRDYLLLVQNNSEPRATGGLPGAYILLRADDGALQFVEQRSAVEIGSFPEPVLDLTRAERGLYGTQLGRYPGNVTSTPDFPRTAQLAREMWRLETGDEVDGVLSVDPVALGMLIGATGTVPLPTGHELTAENTAQLLLNEPYLSIPDPVDQDVFFATAAGAVFDGLLSRSFDPAAVVGALDASAQEGRLMVWSARPEEQSLIAGTQLSGELRGHVGDSPLVGIYVHDTSGAKIAYYEHIAAEILVTERRPDGSQQLAVTVTASSNVPPDVGQLPPLLTGGGKVIPLGSIRSQISVYAPTGGRILSAGSDDPSSTIVSNVHDGLPVVAQTIVLTPGETETLTVDVETAAGQAAQPVVHITPGPNVGQFLASTT